MYRRSIDCLDRTPLRLDIVRARLLYGEFCGESPAEPTRNSLRFAYEQFSVLGAHAFAERARIELLATGEELRPRAADGDRQ